uniref:Uncharacterized protein n=1 Tax=Parastrongyloides trichosuri TaxID=131310 RepID=A0A0N4Z624_PARTI
MNITLRVDKSLFSGSDLDIDIIVGGFHDTNNKSIIFDEEKDEDKIIDKIPGHCIKFAKKFELSKDDSYSKSRNAQKRHSNNNNGGIKETLFSKPGIFVHKTLSSSHFDYVSDRCNFNDPHDYKKGNFNLNSCIPRIDYFILYAKGLSFSPETVFDLFDIFISLSPTDEILNLCKIENSDHICDLFKKDLSKFDVSYKLDPDEVMILNVDRSHKFVREEKGFNREDKIGTNSTVNDLTFDCTKY